jgi:hypothetical protein
MVYLVVNATLLVVLALTWRGFFWPVFPMLGWGSGCRSTRVRIPL